MYPRENVITCLITRHAQSLLEPVQFSYPNINMSDSGTSELSEAEYKLLIEYRKLADNLKSVSIMRIE